MVEVLVTDEFEAWWDGLSVEEQESVAHDVSILRELGVRVGFPKSSGVAASKYDHMRERVSNIEAGRSASCMHSTPIAPRFC
jgi:hypothetical protein